MIQEEEEIFEQAKWSDEDQAKHFRKVRYYNIQRKVREAMKFLSFLALVSLWWNSYKMFVLLQEALIQLETIAGK